MKNARNKLVLVIADSGLGGGTSHVLSLLKNVDKDKFETHLICPAGYLSKTAKALRDVEVYNISMHSKFDLISFLQLRETIAKIQSEGNPFGPMIVHAHGQRAGLFTAFAARKYVRKIYTEHNFDDTYQLKNPINNFIQKQILRAVCRRYDLIIAVSEAVKKYLVGHRFAENDEVVVMPNGIDLTHWLDLKKKHKIETVNRHPVIGTVGSLVVPKGQKYLIQAFAQFTKKYPLARLEIVGDGPEKTSLQELATGMLLNKNVSFLGVQKDVAPIISKWDMFVLPSVSETFGIVILEAMALGLPVVATKVGGVPDIIDNGKNGILVESKDSIALCKAMEKILDHPALAAELKRGGEKRIADFDITKIVEKIENIYLRLIG
ncbi:MAG: glycosyltransferase family 4 protein [Candidatus Berkelbacteria bacterium]